MIVLPIACQTTNHVEQEKKQKKGYLGSITDKLTGTPSPQEHKTTGISYFKKGMIDEALD